MNTCYLCRHRQLPQIRVQKNGWTIAKCASCGLVQIVPRPSQKEVNALYDHDWEHFTPYRSASSVHRHYFRKILSQHVFQTRPLKLLDVGCATGILLDEAKKLGIHATGIDISKDAVAHCKKQKLNAYEGTVASFARTHTHHSFDIVTAFEVIEHEQDPFLFLGAIRRLLKPGGTVMITTPNFDTIWRTLMGSFWVGYKHPEHLWFFTPDSLSDLIRRADFSGVTITSDYPRPYSMGYAFKRLSDYFPFFRPLFNSLSKYMGNISVPVNPWGDIIAVGKT